MTIKMQQNPGTSMMKARKKKSKIVPLREMFAAYCLWDPVAGLMDFDTLAFSQLDRWLISAKIIDMSRVTTTDAFLCFFEFRKRAIEYHEFLLFLENLAETKDLCLNDMKYKLQSCEKPPLPPEFDSDDEEKKKKHVY